MAEIVEFNGKRYSLNPQGYYTSTIRRIGERTQLHRDIYEFYSGEKIPKGYVIHHKDRNRANNSFDNLLCCTTKEHLEIHSKEQSERTQNMIKEYMKTTRICKQCGKEYHPTTARQLFCTKNCSDKYLYDIGKGRVERTCQYCGKKFMGVRRKHRKFCSRTCSARYGAELIKSKSVG